MKFLIGTSIIVEIDRHHEDTIQFLQDLVEKKEELIISMATVTEILTGSYLRRDANIAVLRAKEILNQFLWKDFEGETAEIAAKLVSYLLLEKKMIEYPDIIIAATFVSTKSDYLITLNKKDFIVFPHIKNQVYTPQEFMEKNKFRVT
ncbi:MAG TPA: type II toxin-antitoxin system VapC family toxin [Candidatus Nanoarchaeia archaeon]|nr:type II toxin-antitoxin system VapC family toxin [Candidatus Nanoarchaeia archaeon]